MSKIEVRKCREHNDCLWLVTRDGNLLATTSDHDRAIDRADYWAKAFKEQP